VPIADPVAVYAAETNQEALLLRHLLQEAGIEAGVTEDLSLAGLWLRGTAPNIHRPKVWVDRARAADAAALLRDYEAKRFARSEQAPPPPADGEWVEVRCERCRKRSEYPAAQRGSVQACLHCRAAVDVGPPDDGDDAWWMAGADDEAAEGG
jgi:hypothetical protein